MAVHLYWSCTSDPGFGRGPSASTTRVRVVPVVGHDGRISAFWPVGRYGVGSNDMPSDVLTVRVAAPDDALAVVRLIERSPAMSREELTERHRATWARMMATTDLTVYVAAFGNDVVGTTAALVMPHVTYQCRPTVFVESMYVLESHRRRGIARNMLQRLLDDAREQGCHKVQLLTHKRHATDGAHDLYRSVGFVAEAEGFRLYLDA